MLVAELMDLFGKEKFVEDSDGLESKMPIFEGGRFVSDHTQLLRTHVRVINSPGEKTRLYLVGDLMEDGRVRFLKEEVENEAAKNELPDKTVLVFPLDVHQVYLRVTERPESISYTFMTLANSDMINGWRKAKRR